jgi:Uma2 family endonuclease
MQDVVFESTRDMSQEEFACWVEKRATEPNRYELLNGRVVMTPPAGYPHGEIEGTVVAFLRQHVLARKLGRVFASSQGFDLPSGDTVAGDASFVSNERWQAAPEPEPGKFLKVVPDLLVEILSASTASRDRGEKKGIYARNGVREYWLVDPRAREVQVLGLDGARYGSSASFASGGRVESRVLPGLEIEVDQLFP